jgi:ElaB/YqjD/DUF883 family membrane-anchored ribosome-binding protein
MELDKNMADPVRSDDFSNSMRFPEAPSSPGSTRTGPQAVFPADTLNPQYELPERATDKPLGEWPEGTFPRRRYHAAAENAGERLGSMVNRARQLPDYMSDRMRDLKQRFRVLRGRAGDSDVANNLRQQASGVADAAARIARKASSRAEYYANNYPVQFIAAAAAMGFFVGFLLRMGRDE